MKNKLLMTAAFAVAATVASHATLVAHYTFDTDGSATVGTDATLGTAASISTTDFVAGGGALSLSGAPTTDTAGLDGAVGGDTWDWSGDSTRTVAFFVKATADDKGDANATMISLGKVEANYTRFDVRLTGNNLRLELQGTGVTTGTTVADGTWHHIAIVVPNATSTIGQTSYYLDGAYVGTFGTGTQVINTGDDRPMRMGDGFQDTGRDFKGLLDDVRLYDNALTAPEIAALAAIPEPATLGMVALFGGAILFIRRKLMV